MTYSREELSNFTLQQLAALYTPTLEEETLVQEMFEQRASVSNYDTLNNLDIKTGWQQEIVQKYINIRRESMTPENAAELSAADQALLEPGVVTKEIELQLQAKLDAKNKRKKVVEEPIEEPVAEIPVEAAPETPKVKSSKKK